MVKRTARNGFLLHFAICLLLVGASRGFRQPLLLGRASPWKDQELAYQLVTYFVLAAVGSTWLSAVLRSRELE
jgi:hypothetical protein